MARPASPRGKRVYKRISDMVEMFPPGSKFKNSKFVGGEISMADANNALTKLEKAGIVIREKLEKTGGRGRPSTVWKKV